MAVINIFEGGARLGAPADTRSNVRMDNSGELAAARQDMALANTVRAGAEAFYNKLVTADVYKANSDYNRQVRELEDKLYQNKEANALDNMKKLEDGRRKIMEKILKDGPQSLRYGAGREKFLQMTDNDFEMQRARMRKYQFQEAENYEKTQAEVQIQDTLRSAADNYGDDAALKGYMGRSDFIMYNLYENYSEERVRLEQEKARGMIAKTAMDAAISRSDYDGAAQLLKKYGDSLDARTRSVYGKSIYDFKENEYTYDIAKSLYETYEGNEEAALAALENGDIPGFYMPSGAENGAWTKKDGVSLDGTQEATRQGLGTLAAMYKKMSGENLFVTSGTDGGALHAGGERSHGGGWKLDVASDWLANADNRAKFIKAAEQMGVKVLDEYEKPSKNSTGGHLDLDFTDFKGGSRQQLNFQQRMSIMKNIKQIASDERSRKERQQAQQLEDWSKGIFQWKEQGLSYTDAMQRATDIGNKYQSVEMLKNLHNMVNEVYSPSTTAIYDETELGNMIKSGRWGKDGNAFITFVGKNFGGKHIADASKLWNEYIHGKGQFSYNTDSLKLEIMGKSTLKPAETAQWNGIQGVLETFRVDFISKYQREPSHNEMVQAGKKAVVENQFGSYRDLEDFFATDVEASRADLYNAGIKDYAKVEGTDNLYKLTLLNGSEVYVTNKELNERYLGNE